ncbi:MAG: PQQ-binding-like beta-propeller repeat protein [Gemmataceae bacterium]
MSTTSIMRFLTTTCLVVLLAARVAGQEEGLAVREGNALPKGAVVRIGAPKLRHGAPGIHLAVAPDGSVIVSAGPDGVLRFWDARTGKERLAITGHPLLIRDLAFSPDGKLVVSATSRKDNTVRVWDATTGKLVRALPGYRDCIGFSADGHLLATVDDKDGVCVLDPKSAKVLTRIEVKFKDIYALSFSPDGKRLAVAGADKLVRVFEISTARQLLEVSGDENSLHRASYCAGGKLLAVSSESRTQFYDAATGKLERNVPAGDSVVTADGKTVAGRRGESWDIVLFDASTGKEKRRIPSRDLVHELAFDAAGRMLVTARHADGEIGLWDAESGKSTALLQQNARPAAVDALALSPDGQLLAVGRCDGTIVISRSADGSVFRELPTQKHGILHLAFAPSGRRLLSGDTNGNLCSWDLEGKQVGRIQVRRSRLRGIALSLDGKYLALAGGEDDTVFVCTQDTGRLVHHLKCPGLDRDDVNNRGIADVAFSADGTRLAAVGRRRGLFLWDVASGKLLGECGTPRQWPECVALSPDGKVAASGHGGGRVEAWNADSRDRLFTGFHDHPWGDASTVDTVVFSPDGRLLFSGGTDGLIRVWTARSGAGLEPLVPGGGRVRRLAFASNGKQLASAQADGSIVVWNSPLLEIGPTVMPRESQIFTAKPRSTFRHPRDVVGAVMSKEGDTVMSVCHSQDVFIWDARTGKLVRTVQEPQLRFTAIAMASDKAVVSAYPVTSKATGGLFSVTREGKRERLLTTDPVQPLVFAADGKSLVGVVNGEVVCWDASTGKERTRLPGMPPYQCAALAPDGKTFARARKVHFHIALGAPDDEKPRVLEGHSAPIRTLAYDSSGRFLLSGGDDWTLRWWQGAREVRCHHLHGEVTCLAISDQLVAVGGEDGAILIIEVASGKQIDTLVADAAGLCAVSLSSDSRLLMAAYKDRDVRLWDLASTTAQVQTEPDFDDLWSSLEKDDAVAAYRALAVLQASPRKSVAFLTTRLQPSKDATQDRIYALVDKLDDEDFEVRERASVELAKLGASAVSALEDMRRQPGSLEAQRRIDRLLDTIKERPPPPPLFLQGDDLRNVRAVHLLERIGSPEARSLLERLASGSRGDHITRAARVARERMKK